MRVDSSPRQLMYLPITFLHKGTSDDAEFSCISPIGKLDRGIFMYLEDAGKTHAKWLVVNDTPTTRARHSKRGEYSYDFVFQNTYLGKE